MADTKLDQVYAEFTRAAIAAIEGEIEERSCGFDSPIEELMFWGMSTACQKQCVNVEIYDGARFELPYGHGSPIAIDDPDGNQEYYSTRMGYWHQHQPDRLRVFPQCKIGRYRVDFVVELGWPGRYERSVVECDGHDYHERTKSQARRDKARDRFLQTFGVPVLRFTGSEIHADPVRCGDQVIAFFAARFEARVREGR